MATLYSTGTQADVSAQILLAAPGDTIQMAAGVFVWGAGNTYISLNKAITLQGAGQGVTVVNISSTAGTYGNAPLRCSAAATIRGFTVNKPVDASPSFVTLTTADGWRITDMSFTWGGWAINPDETYGLIDHCTFTGVGGTAELIFIRGKLNSWQTAHSLGGADNVFIEDCIFAGEGYICDANDNSRVVCRFNTISGTIKFDCHGKHSNNLRGSRHHEVYYNTWTNPGSNFACIEIRGGSGYGMFNTYNGGGNPFNILLNEYFVIVGGQTSANWPYDDGIGVGQDPKAGGSAPVYLFGNRKNGVIWGRDNYGSYVDGDGIVDSDRDYFIEEAAFDGTSGVGIGTRAQMDAITPTLTGVGFWVTDEGLWRAGYTGNSGRFYKWSGSAWVLEYTPYSYPHPANDGGGPDTTPPSLLNVTIPTGGNNVALAFTENVIRNAGTPTVSLSGGPCTLSYAGGSGTALHNYTPSRTINALETGTLSVTLATDDWKDAANNSMTTISGATITNASTQGGGASPPPHQPRCRSGRGGRFAVSV